MNRTAIPGCRRPGDSFLRHRSATTFLILTIACAAAAFGEDVNQPKNSPVSIRVTHLLGFEGAPNNANGTLTIATDALRFQREGKPAVEVKIVSVQDIFLGDESRQVGGLPMTLGKAAVPFGGGRAVSLFAHKKYDTLTLEYIDANGGFHGAIFQLGKGQGGILRNELVAGGAHVTNHEDQSAKQHAAEVSSENQ
jgi:hypothetical protein